VVNNALIHALWDGIQQSSLVETTVAGSGVDPGSADIALGPGGAIHISYGQGTNVRLSTSHDALNWTSVNVDKAAHQVAWTRVVGGATNGGGVGVGFLTYPPGANAGELHYGCAIP
jgi:hypothetical protein